MPASATWYICSPVPHYQPYVLWLAHVVERSSENNPCFKANHKRFANVLLKKRRAEYQNVLKSQLIWCNYNLLCISKGSFICTIPQTVVGMKSNSTGPPGGVDPTTHRTMSEHCTTELHPAPVKLRDALPCVVPHRKVGRSPKTSSSSLIFTWEVRRTEKYLLLEMLSFVHN